MKNKKTLLVGVLILLVAVVIVLAAIFLPMSMRKKDMKQILQAVPSAGRISLWDPSFDTGDVLGNQGKEVLLEGEDLEAVRARLAALVESGYRYSGEEKGFANGLDLHLKIRSAEGEIFYLWLGESRFYCTQEERVAFFEAKDAAVYDALRAELDAILQQK